MSITTNVSLKKLKAHLAQQSFSFYTDNTMSRCCSQNDYCLCPRFWHVDYYPSLYFWLCRSLLYVGMECNFTDENAVAQAVEICGHSFRRLIFSGLLWSTEWKRALFRLILQFLLKKTVERLTTFYKTFWRRPSRYHLELDSKFLLLLLLSTIHCLLLLFDNFCQ